MSQHLHLSQTPLHQLKPIQRLQQRRNCSWIQCLHWQTSLGFGSKCQFSLLLHKDTSYCCLSHGCIACQQFTRNIQRLLSATSTGKHTVDAIYRVTLGKWPHAVPSYIGAIIKSKLTEIRGKNKPKNLDTETLMLFDDKSWIIVRYFFHVRCFIESGLPLCKC